MKLLPFLLILVLFACNYGSTSEVENTSIKPVKPGNLEFFEVYSFEEMNMEAFQSSRLKNLVSFAFDSTYYFVKEKDIRKVDSILAISEIKKEFPKDLEFMWSYGFENSEDSIKGRYLYAIKIPKGKVARIDGRYVNSANLELHGGRHHNSYINLTMTIDGTVEWEKMTEDNLGHCIAITMDHKVIVCPRVNCSIQSGTAGIEGNFSLKELEELTARINRGRR